MHLDSEARFPKRDKPRRSANTPQCGSIGEMKTLRCGMIVMAALLVSSALAQRSGTTPCATAVGSETSPWRVYIDRDRHFCFRYPGSYTPIAHPKPSCRGPKLEDKKSGANIGVCVLDEDFRADVLVGRMAPAFDSPPKPQRIGQNTFYHYGPGGGGVSYPESYYFNLRGKILAIDFGPYEKDKTPTAETKQKEQEVLASLREF